MRVIAHVLRKIDDDKPLARQIASSPAIANLVSDYNDVAILARSMEDSQLLLATSETYGSDFKSYLSRVPSLDLHRMLDRYLSHFSHHEKGNATKERSQVSEDDDDDEDSEYETPAAKEKRRHRFWLIRAAVITGLAIFFAVGGAMMAVWAHSHNTDNAVFKVVMGTATELLKIIFSTK